MGEAITIQKEYVLIAVPADVVPTGALDAAEGWEFATEAMLRKALGGEIKSLKDAESLKSLGEILKAPEPMTEGGVLMALTDMAFLKRMGGGEFDGAASTEIAAHMGRKTARGKLSSILKNLKKKGRVHQVQMFQGKWLWDVVKRIKKVAKVVPSKTKKIQRVVKKIKTVKAKNKVVVSKFASYPITEQGTLSALKDIAKDIPNFAGCAAKDIAYQMGEKSARGILTTYLRRLEEQSLIRAVAKHQGQILWSPTTPKKAKKGKK